MKEAVQLEHMIGENWDCSAFKREDKRGQVLLLSSNISYMGGYREMDGDS